MNTKGTYSKLLDELIAGNPQGAELEKHLDMILIWLAKPESQSVIDFRDQYKQRKISDEILRGYVLFVLEQKLFAKQSLTPYQTLGLPTNATKEQSKSRYRKLIRIYHPDRGIGDLAILNSHAEKINLAYKLISTGDRLAPSIQAQTVYSSKNVTPPSPPIEIKSKNDDLELIAGKLRRKFGGVKQFQKIFFSMVIVVCLFLVLLIYFQSGPVTSGDSYYKTKSKLTESAQVNDESVVGTTEDETLLSKDKLDSALSNDSGVAQQSVASEVEENQQNRNDEIKNILLGLEEENDAQDEKDLNISSLRSDNLDEQRSYSNVLNQEYTELKLTEKKENFVAKDLDSNAHTLDLVKSEPKTKDQVSQTNIVKSESVKIKPKKSVVKTSKPKSDSTTRSKLTKVETPNKDSEIQTKQAPVKEIEVVSKSPKSGNYSKANIFERKFAHNFIVGYLESIERGDIGLINNFLSDSLTINGTSNFKNKYLSSTTSMIKQTNKRTYAVKFIGDVLRVGKGHFRVKLRQQHNHFFKDSTNTKKNSTISYDIKRYRNGSEIVSISEV